MALTPPRRIRLPLLAQCGIALTILVIAFSVFVVVQERRHEKKVAQKVELINQRLAMLAVPPAGGHVDVD